MKWSEIPSTLESKIDHFRDKVIDGLLKDLIEQKTDSKKFLEDEKRQYESEQQKVNIRILLFYKLNYLIKYIRKKA